jgi:hypothetical protein
MKNSEKRAKELHNLIQDEFKKRKITIAVGNTDSNFAIVGTSEKYMQKDVLNEIEENEVLATPNQDKHAEEDIIEEADKREVNVTEIGASRPICSDCEELIKQRNITAKTKFSGKLSRKRRT